MQSIVSKRNCPRCVNSSWRVEDTAGRMLHVARTVCRRAERRVVTLSEKVEVHPNVIQYLNRLSDFLFVLARVVNHREGKEEIPW